MSTATMTASTAVKSASGDVHWLTISNSHATNDATVSINNSLAGSGSDKFVIILGGQDTANGPLHCEFPRAPIHCDLGIYVTISGGTVKVNIGYD